IGEARTAPKSVNPKERRSNGKKKADEGGKGAKTESFARLLQRKGERSGKQSELTSKKKTREMTTTSDWSEEARPETNNLGRNLQKSKRKAEQKKKKNIGRVCDTDGSIYRPTKTMGEVELLIDDTYVAR
ncbi:hypothetical protein BHE74_00035398, partial [Ensete ventricosum]